MSLIAAIDQGTTSTRIIVFDGSFNVVASAQLEHRQITPKPGWVEHNPLEIIEVIGRLQEMIAEKLQAQGLSLSQIAGVGITNQRETTVVWDRFTGRPLHNAVVWLDTRTHETMAKLARTCSKDAFREKTGLPIASYFSGLKLRWLIDNVPAVREAARDGRCLFGTIDTWLIWTLTGGPEGGVHVTDVTNASRTMIFNIHTLQWDEEICRQLEIPMGVLPQVRSSSEVYGRFAQGPFKGIPIAGCLGDQQSALVGQKAFTCGEAKNTYGTGCFLLMNMGERPMTSKHGLLTTVAYKLGPHAPVHYAFEGSVAIAGAAVKWLGDNMGLIPSPRDIGPLASSVPDTGGVYFVPAFSGLFAPRWREDARGLVIGMSQFTTKAHVARAVEEAICFQTREVLEAMEQDSGVKLRLLRVDGGASEDGFLMQWQADLLGTQVVRPACVETTAMGTAFAAALATGFCTSTADIETRTASHLAQRFTPAITEKVRERAWRCWNRAVERSIGWLDLTTDPEVEDDEHHPSPEVPRKHD
ncbi:putative Glycerol kinase [Paratrimastix pyriformis]|uniref:glycerol kinase n=1 Tax=Paratrimastix pyriformis TaxID=342808 RepID=A0ABQ8UWV7_9EUKA|nr:putative Glycerol kinase [Paratrimastix pyriformis]